MTPRQVFSGKKPKLIWEKPTTLCIFKTAKEGSRNKEQSTSKHGILTNGRGNHSFRICKKKEGESNPSSLRTL